MKILHVCLVVPNSPQTALRNALRGISTEYREYSWCEARERGEDTSLGILLANLEFEPDVTFMQLQDPTVLQPTDAAAMVGILIQWSGDVRQPLPEWYSNLGKVLNISLFSNETDPVASKARGANAHYMDIGFDSDIWNPSGSYGNWPEIVFLGSNFGDAFPLSQLRRDMVARLASRYGERFGCYGHGWSGPRTFPLIPIMEEAECYRSAKIAINLSHFDLDRYSSDRLLRALGCGPMVLTHNYQGLSKDWVDGGDLVSWDSLDDLEQKIDKYLADDTLRMGIAEVGCAKAHREHTWYVRIKNELLPLINKLTAERK